LATLLARLLAIDTLHAFALITLLGLAVLCYAALHVGARRFGSAGAGLLIAWLALAGLNPLGLGIAVHRAVTEGTALFEFPPMPVETVFVSDESAELFMAHPLLDALHVSGDWRSGQVLPWFLDNSPRGPALALLLPLVALMLARPSRRTLVGGFALGAGSAALSPSIGLPASSALFACALLSGVIARVARHVRPAGPLPAHAGPSAPAAGIAVAAAGLTGALAAAPTYLQAFTVGAEPVSLRFEAELGAAAIATAASFCALAPLAVIGALRASAPLRPALVAIAFAGLALAAAEAVLRFGAENDHALATVAGVLLAVPALGFVSAGRLRPLASAALLAAFLPTTFCTLASFAGRPALPIARHGAVLVRLPSEDPLARLYAWIRNATGPDAIFVVDSGHTVKMASTVSELPALSGRALFVDQAHALTTPYPEFEERRALAAALTAGDAASSAELATLAAFARPVFLVSHAADDEHLAADLAQHWGPPLFVADFVAVYALVGT
jgi:hypothetical protein